MAHIETKMKNKIVFSDFQHLLPIFGCVTSRERKDKRNTSNCDYYTAQMHPLLTVHNKMTVYYKIIGGWYYSEALQIIYVISLSWYCCSHLLLSIASMQVLCCCFRHDAVNKVILNAFIACINAFNQEQLIHKQNQKLKRQRYESNSPINHRYVMIIINFSFFWNLRWL